jgi:AraC-like DNA-binding protein
LRDLGVDPCPVFAAEGFDPARFADPDAQIPFVPASRLLARCVEETGCDHLGLLLGERTVPSLLGLPGYLLHTAPDVGTALRALVRYLGLHDRGAVAILTTDGQRTSLGYAIHLPRVEAADQIKDLAVTVICQIMRSLCGAGWNPAEVFLSRRPPEDPALYGQFFRAPVRFDADRSAAEFSPHWLDHPVANADPLLFRYLTREAEMLRSSQHGGFRGEVRRILCTSLAMQKSSASAIGNRLAMHRRTLDRRLRQEGTTFRRELEDARYELARQLLADTRMPLGKIAAALGYTESTAFIRAFKRWSGTSPAAWRALQTSSPNDAPAKQEEGPP